MVIAKRRLRSIESMKEQFAELDQRLAEVAEGDTEMTQDPAERGAVKPTELRVAALRSVTPDTAKTPFLRLAMNGRSYRDDPKRAPDRDD